MFSEQDGSGGILMSSKKAAPFKNYMIGSVVIPHAYMLYIFVLENQFSSIIQNEFGTFKKLSYIYIR